MDFRIISLGVLSRHELRGETQPVRTAHATTTLIRSDDRLILVDPGPPPSVITTRLHERSGLRPDDITDVFLTTHLLAHRRGLPAFEHARWWMSQTQRDAVERWIDQLRRENQDPMREPLIDQLAELMARFETAADDFAKQVDLFPLPGYGPDRCDCGLLLSGMNQTTLLAGDAVATGEHLLAGQVLTGADDEALARESLAEAVEIADAIVPGHDNLMFNPTHRPF